MQNYVRQLFLSKWDVNKALPLKKVSQVLLGKKTKSCPQLYEL